MKCPSCGFNNIPGSDLCEFCDGALASLDHESLLANNPLLHDSLSSLKPKEALSLNEGASIYEAITKMNKAEGGCVVIIDNWGNLRGIVTERDILLRAKGKISDFKKDSVSEIMTTRVDTLTEETPIAAALNFMSVHRYRHIPVLQKNNKIGILSARDVLQYLAKQLV